MKNALDLRLVIGAFFFLVGLLLFGGSFLMHPDPGKTEAVNRWCGLLYVVFGVVMLLMWKAQPQTDGPESEQDSSES